MTKRHKKRDNVPSGLLTVRQWPHYNSFNWENDIHHVLKCMSYHGAIGGLVITAGKAHCISL